MPVVSGLKNNYSYRCDGSNNTGGVRPAELIALASVSISRMTDASSSEDSKKAETNALAQLAAISENYYGVVPDETTHSMTLVPLSGTRWYTVTQNEDKTVTYTIVENYGNLSDEEKAKCVSYKYVASDSVGVQVYPIETITVTKNGETVTYSRFEYVEKIYEEKVKAWQDENTNQQISTNKRKELMTAAEREVQAVGIRFVTLTADYLPPVAPQFKAKNLQTIDTKHWTPKELDVFGVLSAINSVWPS